MGIDASQQQHLFGKSGLVSLLRMVSRRELGQRKGRAALFVMSIALGMAMITSIRLSTEGAVANFSAELERQSGKADLQVSFGTGESGFPEEFLEIIRGQEFVEDAAAMVRGSLRMADGSGTSLELFGVDILQSGVLDLYETRVLVREPDDLVIINDPYAVFLAQDFADSRALELGDTLDLTSARGTHRYTVRGIVAAGGLAEAFRGQVVVMFLPAAQYVIGKGGDSTISNIDQIDIVLPQHVDTMEARRRLRSLLPPELAVEVPAQRRLNYERAVSGLSATLQGISWFVMLAALFVVYSTTTALVSHRMPAMATLLIVGVRPRSLTRLVVVEAGILGFIGSLVGVGLGVIMARFVLHDIQGGMSLNYWLDFSGGGPAFKPLEAFLIQPAIGAAVAMVSSYGPARQLLDTAPLEIKSAKVGAEASRRLGNAPVVGVAFVLLACGAAAIGHGVGTQTPATASLGCLIAILGTLLLALPLVPIAWRALQAPMARTFAMPGRIAAANLNRNLARSVILVGGIALCGAVAVGASTLPESFRSSSWSWYGFSNDAIVSSRTLKGGWLNEPISGDLVDDLAAMQSVAGVEAIRVAHGQVYSGERVAAVALSDGMLGVALERAVELDAEPSEAYRALVSGEAFAVSNNFAAHYGIRAGDEIVLPSPTGLMRRPVTAVIPDYVSDRGSVLMAMRVYRDNWKDDLVTFYSIKLAKDATLESLNSEVTRSLGAAHDLSVMSSSQLRERTDQAIELAFADVDAIQLLLIAVTFAGIIDFLVTTILDRRREMVLVNAIGATTSLIRRSVALEAGVIGLTAGVIGAIVGIVFSWIWITYTYPVLVGYVLTLNVSLPTTILCVAGAGASAAAAGAFAVTGVIRSSIAEGAYAG